MKLTNHQLQKIESHLNFTGLTHLDVRNEVIDHMATDIEKSMEETSLDFNGAFDTVIGKWKNELGGYSSFWLGVAWVGPKLMIQKAVQKIKNMYLRTILVAVVIMGLLYILSLSNLSMVYEVLRLVIGSLYAVFLGVILFFHFRIRSSGYHTSFRFLYKTHAVGFAFMYLGFNPLIVGSIFISAEQSDFILLLFFHSLLISNAYNFYDLYKSHFETQKYIVA
ncbi:hypothetical protein [Aurantibacter sp.]|uniref:hypothetical protein n=1 Tax=Aurantibacter sp. TaxID=2807103 RepID=UPI003263E99F